jgi:hypothetical protein
MGDLDWQEEQRRVLGRLFDAAFSRRETSEDQIGQGVHRLETVDERLDDDDLAK